MKNSIPKYESDLLRDNADCLLLFLINENWEAYGYQLIKEIENRSKGYFQFREGTVYPDLHQLESDGFIQGKWRELPNGQERRYYTITEKGKQALDKKMAAWRGFTTAVDLVFKPT